MQKAIDQFPEKVVPKDRDERIEIVEKIEERSNEIWEELDQEFFEYVDDLNALNVKYVRQNREYF